MPLSDDFLLTQITIDLVDGPRSRARLHVDPDDVRGRGLDATFLNVRQVVDMTDAAVMLWWQHDQAPALRGLERFEAVDASVGRWKVHWPTAMGQSAGTVTAKIMVTEGDREVAIPLPTLEVSGDRADPSATPSEDTFSVLAELLLQYQEGVPAIETAIEEVREASETAQRVAGEVQGAVDAANGAAARASDVAEDVQGKLDAGEFVGPKGDPGPRGERGETGEAAGFGEVTATVDRTSGDPSVTVSTDGPATGLRLAFDFKGLKGETGPEGAVGPTGPEGPRGPKGDRGDVGEGLKLLGVFDSEEALREAVPRGERAGDAYMAGESYFVWDGTDWRDAGHLQGAKGDRGEAGPAGPAGPAGADGPEGPAGRDGAFSEVTVSTDGTHLDQPTAEAVLGGEPGAQTLAISFTGLMGPTGPRGDDGAPGENGRPGDVGPAGPPGEDGRDGAPGRDAAIASATATSDATHLDEPTVTVEVGGEPGAQTLSFDFKGLMGPQGPTGPAGPDGPAGPAGAQGPAFEPGGTSSQVVLGDGSLMDLAELLRENAEAIRAAIGVATKESDGLMPKLPQDPSAGGSSGNPLL